jgi:hypothetical protein
VSVRRPPIAATVLVLLAACGSSPFPPEPTPRPSPLPTRIVRLNVTPQPTATTAPATPTAPVVRRVFTQGDFDPYAALYVSEREGIYVTTRNLRGRYYYKWDDRRWLALQDRVWFRTVEDLLTVFPTREAAP